MRNFGDLDNLAIFAKRDTVRFKTALSLATAGPDWLRSESAAAGPP
jgi:hypothetical protein